MTFSRIFLSAALLAAVPMCPALADSSEASPSSAATTTETSSGTTTYFGKAEGAKTETPTVAKKEPVAKPRPLPPTLTATVDLSRQTMTVFVNGDERYRWRISSGTKQFATPTGTFYPQWTSAMWYSKKYDNAPMPHAVFINGGVAVHGTEYTKWLGSPASHGCIRLAPRNAKTFYDLVQRHGLMRTRVSVRGRPNWRDTQTARRDSRRDDDNYADNGGGWLFGNWGGDYDQRDRRKSRKDYRYVYKDGVRVKVYRDKRGAYIYKKPSKSQRYTSNNAYEAD